MSPRFEDPDSPKQTVTSPATPELITMILKLSEMVKEDLILPALHGKDAAEILRELTEALYKKGCISTPDGLYERLTEREKQESTGIGNGVAIPHCKLDEIQDAFLVVGFSKSGIDFHALDGKPTFYFFLVVTPTGSSVLHLRILAALSRLLKSNAFRNALHTHPSTTDLMELIRKEEELQSSG